MQKPLLYLCAPVTATPCAAEALAECARLKARLISAGFRVIAPSDWPANLDNERLYMAVSLAALPFADKVVKMPGTNRSKGARAELALADKLGIPIAELSDLRLHLVQGEL